MELFSCKTVYPWNHDNYIKIFNMILEHSTIMLTITKISKKIDSE